MADNIRDLLEPSIKDVPGTDTLPIGNIADVSAAISLKRIADALNFSATDINIYSFVSHMANPS